MSIIYFKNIECALQNDPNLETWPRELCNLVAEYADRFLKVVAKVEKAWGNQSGQLVNQFLNKEDFSNDIAVLFTQRDIQLEPCVNLNQYRENTLLIYSPENSPQSPFRWTIVLIPGRWQRLASQVDPTTQYSIDWGSNSKTAYLAIKQKPNLSQK